MKATHLITLLLSMGLLGTLAGCQGQDAPSPEPREITPGTPANASQAAAPPEIEFSPLQRGPRLLEQAPGPELRAELAPRFLSMSLMTGRTAARLASGAPIDQPAGIAPFTFIWPLDETSVPLATTWQPQTTNNATTPGWTVRTSPTADPQTIVQTGLSADQQARLGQPKVDEARELVSAVFANGNDERSRMKRWHAVERKGTELLGQEQARRLVCGEQLGNALFTLVQTAHHFPQSAAELSAYGLGLINVVDAPDAQAADVTLAWDGEQAYLITIRLNQTASHERVVYFEALGMEPDPEATPLSIGNDGATMLPSGDRSITSPRFLYDAAVGRTFQPLGAWNLVPEAAATIPLSEAPPAT